MTQNIGIWIDHRQAVIVSVTDEGASKNIIKSNVEKHVRAAGDPTLKGPFKARMVPADDKREREFNGHIKIFYNKIIDRICHAEAVFIFGPGETKDELKKQLEKNNLGGLISGIETADKMTNNQILANVCKHFHMNIPPNANMTESPHQRMKTSPSSAHRQV